MQSAVQLPKKGVAEGMTSVLGGHSDNFPRKDEMTEPETGFVRIHARGLSSPARNAAVIAHEVIHVQYEDPYRLPPNRRLHVDVYPASLTFGTERTGEQKPTIKLTIWRLSAIHDRSLSREIPAKAAGICL